MIRVLVSLFSVGVLGGMLAGLVSLTTRRD